MAFASFSFLFVFLPAIVILNFLLLSNGRASARKQLFLGASVLFYALSSAEALPILAGSLCANFYIVRRMQQSIKPDARKRCVVFGLTFNILLLAVFKYSHFAAENMSWLLHVRISPPVWVLPLGISFYTIQQVIYLVDCYEQMISSLPLLEHSIFISFFPYIAAGPIVHAADLTPQLESRDRPGDVQLNRGLMLIAIGLTKKVVLAESFRHFAEAGFAATGIGNVAAMGLIDGWITALSYTFQIYLDFSGYSDMALGIASMLGLELPRNFDSPFKAVSLIEFWKRWHISLSRFITTYLYTPMVRAMRPVTFVKAMLATLLAMLIAGLWHGPAWTFLIFGGMHGLGLVINNVWRKTRIKLPAPIAWILTFVWVVLAFVVFRAPSWNAAARVLSSMFGVHTLSVQPVFAGIPRISRAMDYVIMLISAVIAFVAPNSNDLVKDFKPSWGWCVACAAMLVLSLVFLNSSFLKDFIYRDF